MDKQVCRTLIALTNSFSNKLGSNKEYQIIINGNILSGYCSSNNCISDLEKINAGCLYLLDAFFKDPDLFKSVAKSNIDIVEYIIIWLSYMLSLKKQVGNTSNLQYFYNTYINNNMYKKSITGVEQYYKNYKDLIDKTKNLINMDMSNISELYDAFKILCNMYLEFDEESPNCNKHSGKANEFVEKYKKIKEDPNVIEGSPYYKLLSTLSNDYDNLKNKCDSFPPLSSIEKTKNNVNLSERTEQISQDASSSSSTTNKLFIVLSIFGAIAFFLGISYKYSLFGFRKRFQKQKLREKLKNIKKKMNQ
ncbi:PIR protein [Plasmodium yoelii]|uniref:PIR protein n=2 Tax=Plasmodium yoelii TaxID=5861 RepID=A0AAE9WSV6_PLAYO|nr:PIR protein [Plasmodium yoelii]WBY56492.1 PIR protein [Plasmodium yoelii yoelii]CDS44474.1 YIR protein [Plasmodium yoelii]VTZ76986.1 PIR protein [Plasmodium yoelii]|eukprot:XP_022810811.1 PIR protein [Plasmodium yoelii]